MTTQRTPLDARPFGNAGLVCYPSPSSPDWIFGHPGELFEELEELHDGRAVQRTILRVVDGKDIIIWRAAYAV